jgi:linolenate 9R-lipoxygenase
VMPANLTRCRPDKYSDEFFVERRLNGFNPGKFKRVEKQPWQYIIRFNCRKHKVEPGGIFPQVIEARFLLESHQLRVHSIQYELNHQTLTHSPGDTDWEWSKKLFRNAEFVFQETQSHLARTHLNVEQYAMAYYRNVVNHPIRLLLEPHLEGLVNVNRLGASVIFGSTGVIPEASALDSVQVELLLKEEIARLTYRDWHPHSQTLKAVVTNNHFDRAALAVWKILEEYVGGFFTAHEAEILKLWPEIQAMSQDLVAHSILDSQYGTLAINDVSDLRQLCIYIIYHSSFLHSWVNYKQYDDGGDAEYASLGIWDSHHSAYSPAAVTQKQIQQTTFAWSLSNVRYNPLMENAPPALKDLFWKHRDEITPGIALDLIMMSIHI